MLDNVASLDSAKFLVGAEIFVSKKLLPHLPPGEYYWFELMGLNVETEDGKFVGKVARIFPTGSNDVYVVRNGRGELLIPATFEVVKKNRYPCKKDGNLPY
jgi:16S rRNA processing protein RimM